MSRVCDSGTIDIGFPRVNSPAEVRIHSPSPRAGASEFVNESRTQDTSGGRGWLPSHEGAWIGAMLCSECGKEFQQRGYRFCPYDGLALDSYRVDGVAMR